MSSEEFLALYKLHRVDAAIASIRRRAAALAPKKDLLQDIDALDKVYQEKLKIFNDLSNEVKSLEEKQELQKQRLLKIDKELYTPGIGSREVDTLQREIESIKKQSKLDDNAILQLWGEIPTARAAVEKVQTRILSLRNIYRQHQQKLLKVKEELQQKFKELSQARPDLTKEISEPLLKQYNLIKSNCGGIGMSEIKKDQTCERCGTYLPERSVEAVKQNKVVTCDSCHRILYFPFILDENIQ